MIRSQENIPCQGSVFYTNPVLPALLLTARTEGDPTPHMCSPGYSLQCNSTVLLKDKVPQYEQEMLCLGRLG